MTDLGADARAVIIGSGIAGLTAALLLGDCVVVTKSALGDGASRWAQGGVAAAIRPPDTPLLHAADTERVAAGIADTSVIRSVTEAAPEVIAWLHEIGADFDTDGGGVLALSKEAGHSERRVVHARGDATGAEIMRALRDAVRERPDITVLEHTSAVDLVCHGGRVVGVAIMGSSGLPGVLGARAVILATGGIGRLYEHTTNPPEATGDGLAMAVRAGAVVRDPEFVQFHPTALASSLDPRPLLTEALRGEGAVLIDADGRRYMTDVHPDAELAPRDVVARANWAALRGGPIALDATRIARVAERFPQAAAAATAAGLDIERDPLPVAPAQHYHMGGVAVDPDGRTSLTGLFAAGEVSCSGLHGANRLASNSLVEGLVYGRRIARAIAGEHVDHEPRAVLDAEVPENEVRTATDPRLASTIRSIMWEAGGLVRTGPGLAEAAARLRSLADIAATDAVARNLITVGLLVLESAATRTESRGAHHRVDHPELDPSWARPTIVDPSAGAQWPARMAF